MHEPSSPDPLQMDGNMAIPEPVLSAASAAPATTAELPSPNGPAVGRAQEPCVERRATPRRRKQIAALVADVNGMQDPSRAWIMDRSLGGLCLAVEEPREDGTLLRVRAASAPTRMPWVDVSVRHCRQKGDVWELGCEFVRTPTWDVLLQFG